MDSILLDIALAHAWDKQEWNKKNLWTTTFTKFYAVHSQLFHNAVPYHIETSPLICYANQWSGFYMIGISVIKELKTFSRILKTSVQLVKILEIRKLSCQLKNHNKKILILRRFQISSLKGAVLYLIANFEQTDFTLVFPLLNLNKKTTAKAL